MIDPVGQYSRPDIFCLNINKNENPHTAVTGEVPGKSAVDRANDAFSDSGGTAFVKNDHPSQDSLLKISPNSWGNRGSK